MCVQVCVEGRGWKSSLTALSLIFLRHEKKYLQPTDSAWLAGQWAARSSIPTPTALGHRCVQLCPAFFLDTRDLNSSPHFTDGAISPAPSSLDLKSSRPQTYSWLPLQIGSPRIPLIPGVYDMRKFSSSLGIIPECGLPEHLKIMVSSPWLGFCPLTSLHPRKSTSSDYPSWLSHCPG